STRRPSTSRDRASTRPITRSRRAAPRRRRTAPIRRSRRADRNRRAPTRRATPAPRRAPATRPPRRRTEPAGSLASPLGAAGRALRRVRTGLAEEMADGVAALLLGDDQVAGLGRPRRIED